jgi:uncharacterized protein with HEPN domain
MTAKDVTVILLQMQHAARRALINSEGLSRNDFLGDETIREAIFMNLLQIGEMASRLTRDHSDSVQSNPQLPLDQMRGMRNRIAHGYFYLDADAIWDTVKGPVPDLLAQLNLILDNGKTHGQG